MENVIAAFSCDKDLGWGAYMVTQLWQPFLVARTQGEVTWVGFTTVTAFRTWFRSLCLICDKDLG